jgi:integration host factor subunit beta
MPTRSDIIAKLAERYPQLSQTDTKLVVATLLDAMTTALSSGERIELRGFGSFSVGYRKARQGRNPATGEPVQVPGKNVIRWKMGKEMRERNENGCSQQKPYSATSI